MAQVDIQVNGREYRVTCDNGQEKRLQQLAAYFDTQVSALSGDLGQIGDARLMLLAALTVCDKMFEARSRVEELVAATDKLDPDTAGAAGKAITAAANRINEISDSK